MRGDTVDPFGVVPPRGGRTPVLQTVALDGFVGLELFHHRLDARARQVDDTFEVLDAHVVVDGFEVGDDGFGRDLGRERSSDEEVLDVFVLGAPQQHPV